VWFAKLVAFSEVGVGIALAVGALTGLAAATGLLMNVNYLLAGSASTNPALAAAALLIVLAWKVAGWWGFDRWLLPRLGLVRGADVSASGHFGIAPGLAYFAPRPARFRSAR
jgi:thiosulfate dehydrogenase [quinone] large subunit